MSTKQNKNLFVRILPIMVLVALGVMVLVVVISKQQSGDIRSRATQDTFLTPSDDPLSLEQDLKTLDTDTTVSDQQSLDSIK